MTTTKFKKFDPKRQLRGLALAATAIEQSMLAEEERNFQECMEFFKDPDHWKPPASRHRLKRNVQ
jgi:hypothetical protein